jgi:hypothetical protein
MTSFAHSKESVSVGIESYAFSIECMIVRATCPLPARPISTDVGKT